MQMRDDQGMNICFKCEDRRERLDFTLFRKKWERLDSSWDMRGIKREWERIKNDGCDSN